MFKFLWKHITLVLVCLFLVYGATVLIYYRSPHAVSKAETIKMTILHVCGFLIIATAHAKAGFDIYKKFTAKKAD